MGMADGETEGRFTCQFIEDVVFAVKKCCDVKEEDFSVKSR